MALLLHSTLPPSLLPSSVMISRRRSKAFSNATIFWMAALPLVSCCSNRRPWGNTIKVAHISRKTETTSQGIRPASMILGRFPRNKTRFFSRRLHPCLGNRTKVLYQQKDKIADCSLFLWLYGITTKVHLKQQSIGVVLTSLRMTSLESANRSISLETPAGERDGPLTKYNSETSQANQSENNSN